MIVKKSTFLKMIEYLEKRLPNKFDVSSFHIYSIPGAQIKFMGTLCIYEYSHRDLNDVYFRYIFVKLDQWMCEFSFLYLRVCAYVVYVFSKVINHSSYFHKHTHTHSHSVKWLWAFLMKSVALSHPYPFLSSLSPFVGIYIHMYIDCTCWIRTILKSKLEVIAAILILFSLASFEHSSSSFFLVSFLSRQLPPTSNIQRNWRCYRNF